MKSKSSKKKSYVSIRIEVSKSGQLNHDIRLKKVNYINDDISNILLDKDYKSIKMNNNDSSMISRFQRYLKVQREEIIKSVYIDTQQHNKRAIQKRTNLELGGIITFSNTMKKDYENSPDLFFQKTVSLLKEFEQTHNTKIINSSIHLDETTPHIHFSFVNYDFKNHRTLKRTMNKGHLEDLQDLGEKHFIDFERGYHRGEKASSTGSKHQTVKQSHSIEKFKKDIETVINSKKLTLNELEDLRQLKRREIKTKTLREEIDGDKQILKELTKKINTQKRFIKTIEKNITKILDKNLGLFGVNRKQLEIDLSLLLEHKIEKGDVLELIEEIEVELNKSNEQNQTLTEKVSQLQEEVEQEKNKYTEQVRGVIDQNIDINNLKSDVRDLKKDLQASQEENKGLNINQDLERKSLYEKFVEQREGNYLDKKKDSSVKREIPTRKIKR